MTHSASYRSYHVQVNNGQPAATSDATHYWQLLLFTTRHTGLKYFLQALIWLVLYFLPVVLEIIVKVKPQPAAAGVRSTVYSLLFMLLVIFSYLNHYLLIPALYAKNYFVNYLLIVGVFMAWPLGLAIAGQQAFFPGLHYINFLFIISASLAIIVRLHKDLDGSQRETVNMKIACLNSQINPHFLFNSLNWIYLLASNTSKETPNAIIQLAGLMRYILKAAATDVIDLAKELDYIKSYIVLQKGRLGNTVSITSCIQPYVGAGKIAPLLAMSFIENAFKYGVNPNEDSAIDIDISMVGNTFYLQVINNKVSPTEVTWSTGAGISNARQRLHLLYPLKHQLEILEDKKIYAVTLSLDIL
ncbi:MAG: histidine kinase [Chitinophagaceae bacterium]